MNPFQEDLYRACQRALYRTTPPGIEKHNYAWGGPWFVWELKRTVASKSEHPMLRGGFQISEECAFVFPKQGQNQSAFYKLNVYLTGMEVNKKGHVHSFTFDLEKEEDLLELNRPLQPLLRQWRDPLHNPHPEVHNFMANVRCGKAISDLHQAVLTAVLTPVEHYELHTDVGSYDEAIMSRLKEDSGNPEVAFRRAYEWAQETYGHAVRLFTGQETLFLRFSAYAAQEDPTSTSINRNVQPTWTMTFNFNHGTHNPEGDYRLFRVFGDHINQEGVSFLEEIAPGQKLPSFEELFHGRPIRKNGNYEVSREFYEGMREALEGSPEHHELHTDVSGYDESATLKEATVYVPEGEETIDLKSVSEEEVKVAYDRWVAGGYPNMDHGYKPGAYAIFARAHKIDTLPVTASIRTIEVSVTLSTAVDIAVALYPMNRMLSASVDAYQTPVEAEPVLRALFTYAREYELPIAQATDVLKGAIEGTWHAWIALWRPVEHHELHTDVGAYDESAGYKTEVRKKTVYAPPRSGKGLPGLMARRDPSDEVHREDYNSVSYDLTKEKSEGEKSWEIKIGNARIIAPRISFEVKVRANATSENPYESGEVQSLVGPPFYSLAIRLVVTPAGGSIPLTVYVARHFDASGTLCWAKGIGTASFRDIFCPMGDLRTMETRVFGETDLSEGYFFAMASGSIADCIPPTDYEKKMNLWKLFHPYVLDLARRPEVRELEKPFTSIGHEELHTDIGGYDEGLR